MSKITKKAVLVFTICSALIVNASELDLSRACIIRARRENPQQKAAADDLAKHLELITGTKPTEKKIADATAIFTFAHPHGEPKSKFTSFARREGNVIRFWGDDTVTRGKPQYGSAFAVAEFLERFLGVLWVCPGDDGIVFTKRTSCDVPDDWTWERKYPFYVSLMRSVDMNWCIRMKHTVRRPFPYRHSFGKWQDRYLKDHPEYFGLDPYGRRGLHEGRSGRAKLCLSNDGCIDQIISNWTSSGTNRFLNICPNDGSLGFCHCEKCLALDERRPGEGFYANLTDRYLNFWNRVTARALAVRSDVKVVTYIYSYYRHPPRREKIQFPDSMLFGIVPSGLDDYVSDLENWKKAGLKSGTFFMRPNFTAYNGKLPRGYERELYEIYHHYLREGSFGFDYDGHYAPEMAFEYYVLMRQLDKPDYSFEQIEDEYCSQYGRCAAVAKAYFARIRERGEKCRRATKESMKKDGNDVLDDSMLSRFAVNGHSEKDLKEDLALLEGADVSVLEAQERKRWDALIATARGYLDIYAAAIDKAKNPPKLKEEGWRASFDLPSFQGWNIRDLKGECTQETASFDLYSVKFTTRTDKSIALWRRDVPVTAGAKYSLSFDVKAMDGVGTVGFRVASGGKTIISKYFRAKDSWCKYGIDFTVPENVNNVTLYFVVGEGKSGKTLYLDNIQLRRNESGVIANVQSDIKDVSIADCGAKSDGTKCTSAISVAVERCIASGGGRVVVPPGTWFTGRIKLASGVELHLCEGAVLEFSDDPVDYLPPVRTAWEGIECINVSPLIYAFGATNVVISGKGMLRARTPGWDRWRVKGSRQAAAQMQLIEWGAKDTPVEERDLTRLDEANKRPPFIGFNRCNNVRLEGFTLRESPFWCIHMFHCQDVVLRNLNVAAHGSNTDGANFESTKGVLVEDCTFEQGDDIICCKSGRDRDGRRRGVPTEDVLVRRCVAKSGHGLFTMGSELSGGVRNVTMEDCLVKGELSTLFNLKTRPTRGGFVENVTFRRIRADVVLEAMVNVTTRNPRWVHLEKGLEKMPTKIDNITVEDVNASKANRIINVCGDAGSPISRLKIRSVSAEVVSSQNVVENADWEDQGSHPSRR